MKKRLVFVFFMVITIVLPCFSQASEAAEEARTMARDFEIPTWFPNEWEAAEALYANAEYDSAADAYKTLIEQAIPLYAQAREDEIMLLRNDLIGLGARNAFPQYVLSADRAAILALDQYEEQDYYAARDSAAEALHMYQVLTSAYSAWQVRQEIRENALEVYDPDNFNLAGDTIRDAMDAYEAGDHLLAQAKAEEALAKYQTVLSAGKRQSAAETIRAAYRKINESSEIARQADLRREEGGKR